ncbi:MAG: hypothetical protein RBS73_15340 [Prolixibacteraceae bacterium]|jgi:hypothetical protein|nr:hypothetical protein [Prolixibacteraceae bacterium]
MKTLKQKLDLTTTDLIIYFMVLGLIAYSFVTLAFAKNLLVALVAEDGPAENLTALMLFAASLVSIYRMKQYGKFKKYGWVIAQFFLALAFFFAAGEELSWGQRIFNIESGEFFQQNNLQGETNLHNLMIGNVKVNTLVFSRLLFVALILYFVFLEFMAKKVTWIGRLVRSFNLPLPKLHHTVMMLFSAIIIQGVYYSRHSELLECVFAAIFFLIFLNPKKWTTEGM